MSTIMPRGSNITMCPECMSPCRTVKSKQITPVFREITFLCTNGDCGHMFVAALSPIRTIDPSALQMSRRDDDAGA